MGVTWVLRGWSKRRRRALRAANTADTACGPAFDSPHLGREFYAQWIGPGSLVFDIGANVGDRTRIFLDLGARVVAVEPQPACAEALRAIRSSRLLVEQTALGASEGASTLRVATASTISSMADDWIERVTRSGRFAEHQWNETITVALTTMDALIARYGRPDFCKIDVEGYESEVVNGLSQSLPMLSFEFAVENSEGADAVLARLEQLGFGKFNFSPEETLSLIWDDWRDLRALRSHLASLPLDSLPWGDIYAAA